MLRTSKQGEKKLSDSLKHLGNLLSLRFRFQSLRKYGVFHCANRRTQGKEKGGRMEESMEGRQAGRQAGGFSFWILPPRSSGTSDIPVGFKPKSSHRSIRENGKLTFPLKKTPTT